MTIHSQKVQWRNNCRKMHSKVLKVSFVFLTSILFVFGAPVEPKCERRPPWEILTTSNSYSSCGSAKINSTCATEICEDFEENRIPQRIVYVRCNSSRSAMEENLASCPVTFHCIQLRSKMTVLKKKGDKYEEIVIDVDVGCVCGRVPPIEVKQPRRLLRR